MDDERDLLRQRSFTHRFLLVAIPKSMGRPATACKRLLSKATRNGLPSKASRWRFMLHGAPTFSKFETRRASLIFSSTFSALSTMPLFAVGFCGVDDSVSPNLLALISHSYPFVEWGVLFRPDLEGQPRYASKTWVDRLILIKQASPHMKLAAHLCGSRVNDLLNGDDHFVKYLSESSFARVQINATAVNGVDTANLRESAPALADIVHRHREIQFIIQRNDETAPLYEGLLEILSPVPSNLVMLFDESKGTGKQTSSWPSPPKEYDIGYAGGIGPLNIESVLENVLTVAGNRSFWIDMESSLRSTKNGDNVVDIDKCYQVIEATCQAGFFRHPSFIPA